MNLTSNDLFLAADAVAQQRTATQRKREQLAKRPIGRNYVARDRQLADLDSDARALSELTVKLRKAAYEMRP
jgi:hypothetical protein